MTENFVIIPTKKFGVYGLRGQTAQQDYFGVYLRVNCSYTRTIIQHIINEGIKPYYIVYEYEDINKIRYKCNNIMQLCDFEHIEWDRVLEGKEIASSYITRKGLSRKAQLALQMKRYTSKNPSSILKKSIPFTVIVDTWNAHEDMKVDFGLGTFASFDSMNTMQIPLRQRLEWCLDDVKDALFASDRSSWDWILKPSVTNKGVDITILENRENDPSLVWEQLLDTLEDLPDTREWVLQRYINRPLLLNGHKFHCRVYVLCVGALQVYVYNNILMLLAGLPYDDSTESEDEKYIYRHLTNTARAAEIDNFDEKKFVKLLDDLPDILVSDRPENFPNNSSAKLIADKIYADIKDIVKDLFSAFENEYTIFNPMDNCFELFGLDFMVDSDYNVSLLEINPGPDFKQTGDRLQRIIVELWKQTLQIVWNKEREKLNTTKELVKDFSLVYDKIWSSSQLQGMKLS